MGEPFDEPEPITFEQAIAETVDQTRYLLLGNGFSIAARGSFSYPSLFRRAGPFSEPVSALFQDLETEDFERVLDALKPRVEDIAAPPSVRQEWKRQEDEVRAAFIQAVQRVHPDNAALMGRDECEQCITSFLEHFVGRRRPFRKIGRIYTTNYDLLLYWVLARSGRRLLCYDSHISPVDDKRYGLWEPEKPPGLVYLHGALHVYERPGGGQAMLRYDGQRSLIAQAKGRLDRGSFPAIVSEGTSEAKAARIARSAYLKWGLKFLRSGLRDRGGVLFTYGHSLDDRDEHLLRHVGTGRIGAIYIGAFGGLEAQEATIRRWMERWRDARGAGPGLRVYVYDTKTFSPWK
ncbi:DUF4917 family protein [Phenylobacterium sp.]|uniref:DUF4917 family protein n=1 Tax=Phenylobacterium sp. TaxID=1871053 RepID=UPI00271DD9A8|nr:DUF4917 family protein [Phenylobacterium sp.]MDO8379998.1 DUF4917 family protein [Phenylobacterium sp.]